MILILWASFIYFFVTFMQSAEYRSQKEYAKLHHRSSYLFRGEAICNDGCYSNILQHESFTIDSSLKLYENGTIVRTITFPSCSIDNMFKFGLDSSGRVYITSRDYRFTEPYEKICIIEDGPYDVILLENNGRLKFVRI